MLKLSCIMGLRGKDLGSESLGDCQLNSAMSVTFLCVHLFLGFSFSIFSFFLLHKCMKIISYHLLNKLGWYFNTEPL